ncbi:hypothetical protein ACFL2Z_02555 [Candidatus Eisenbacteria bacterium]|uniref:Phosphatidylinositol diacylglycerol-lyase n=1 Tax=Eiseniibacteriota bacterium TaxID=2212470 RepID=A0ABV6YNY2_UNCEI
MRQPDRVRRYAGGACLVAGIIAIVLATLLAYGSLVLFDAGAFSDRVGESLGEPGVAALVSQRLTDNLIAQRRDLTPYKPLILSATQAVVTSGPFRGVVRRGARLAHEAVLAEGASDVLLTVSDVSVILKGALAESPELAEKIPDEAMPVLASSGEIPNSEAVLALLRLARRLSSITSLILASGIGLLTLGLLLFRRRRLALLWMGLTLTASASLLLFLMKFGGSFLAAFAKDPQIGRAIAGLWSAFLGGYADWALVLCGMGIILASAATSLMERVRLAEAGRATWRWLSAPSDSRVTKALRGVVLIGLGLLSVLYPGSVLLAVIYLCGGVLLFLGMNEIFRMILGAIPADAERDIGASISHFRHQRRAILVVALAAILVAAGALVLMRGSGTVDKPSTSDGCNGSLELCDRRLDQVVFPGTHNSMGAADIPKWMFPNQERGIARQLNDGIRALLIDTHNGIPVGDRVKTDLEDEAAARRQYEEVLGREGVDAAMRIRDRLIGGDEGRRGVYLCHGFCELGDTPFVPMLGRIREFLVLNPNEVLIIVIQDEGVTPREIEACFAESGLIDFVYRGDAAPPWPTLGEMVARGEQVLVMTENESAGVAWIHPAFEVMQETPYRFHDPSEFSCEPNRGGTGGSLLLMNHWIETAPAPQPRNAEIVNAHDFLLSRARRCEKERGMLPNIIAVDFYRTGALIEVARTLNGVDSPPGNAR